MSPNFAFSLSQDILRLLIRVDGGWAELGSVATDAPDMAERLADLRDEATRRAPLGMMTKLIIPNDYIRYMTLERGQSGDQAVRDALVGVTPYAVDELAIDHDTDAAGTHVAAVGLDFLAEAEKFALDHGLRPVSFVAVPREGSFEREVFFGKTSGADRILPGGAELGPENDPMTLVALPVIAPKEEDTPDTSLAAAPAEVPIAQFSSIRRAPAAGAPASPASSDPAPHPAPVSTNPDAPAATKDATARSTTDPASRNTATQPPASSAPSDPADTAPAPLPSAKDTLSRIQRKPAAPAQRSAQPLTQLVASPPRRQAPLRAPASTTTAPPSAPPTAPSQPRPSQPLATAAPAAARRPAIARELAGIGGTRFAQTGLAAAALALLLGFGWLLLRSGPDAPVLETPEELASLSAQQPSAPAEQQIPATASEPTSSPPTLRALPEITPSETLEVLTQDATPLSEDQARRAYAATGVWQKSPAAPRHPRQGSPEFGTPGATDAPTTPARRQASATPDQVSSDRALVPPQGAPVPGQRFIVDENGLVTATPEGALTPGGILAFARAPGLVPPTRPGTEPPAELPAAAPSNAPATQPTDPAAAQPAAQPPATSALATGIPRPSALPPTRPAAQATPEPPASAPAGVPDTARPSALPPSRGASLAPSDATAGAVSLAGLASTRPAQRPEDFAPIPEELDVEPEQPPSPYAVTQSLRPSKRPRNIGTLVAAAQRTPQPSAPAVSQPAPSSGPTAQGVAARATQENAIRLSQINLIGVYGTERNRRALVRLSNGRMVKVSVGDRLDGGRVSAIGSRSLRYSRGGSQVTLEIPG